MTETRYSIDLGDTSSGTQEAIFRECNLVAFAAHLTQSGLTDRSKHFSIRMAFEEEPDQRSKAYLKQGPRLDVYVPLAAIWIFLAGMLSLHIFVTREHLWFARMQGKKELEGSEWVFN